MLYANSSGGLASQLGAQNAIRAALLDVDTAMLLAARSHNLTDGSTVVLAYLAGEQLKLYNLATCLYCGLFKALNCIKIGTQLLS